MIRLAARWADQWDTFPELPGTATDGVTTTVEERIAMLDAACAAIGRDPATIRRSVWARSDMLKDPAAYVAFARRHLELGFTDIAVSLGDAPRATVRRIAEEVVPALRSRG
jgi:hypothetical protein